MMRKDAKLILSAVAKAVRERFVGKADHDALVRRVEQLEREFAELRKREDAGA